VIVAGTGHRFEDSESEEIVRTKARVKLQYTEGVTTFITGMAPGYDLWAGDEARLLGLELWCAKPWAGHTARKEDRELYDTLIAYASRVVNVDESKDYKGPWVYQRRNEWMVDNADVVMAYWSGVEKGGTYNCYQYAKKINKPITNIYNAPPF
jgi:uncharacterized phage-like protein YoqJ